MPNCDDCAFGLYKDVGYSNWTVEGTDFICRHGVKARHSAESFETIPAPSECDKYLPGNPVRVDVESRYDKYIIRDYPGDWW